LKTVDKAMKLLNIFSIQKPEIGLSELARLSGFDKAATRRFLVALQKHDFIDQDSETRKYRLGNGFLHLSKIREATFSIEDIIGASIEKLSSITKETSHAALISNKQLKTICISFPSRSNRVHLDHGEIMPMHATSSGLTYMAYSKIPIESLLPETLTTYTDQTLNSIDSISSELKKITLNGFGSYSNGYESDVIGIAVPIFSANQDLIGTMAVASPTSRITDELRTKIQQSLFTETITITKKLGGEIPLSYQRIIENNSK